jgi:hypothetical protein
MPNTRLRNGASFRRPRCVCSAANARRVIAQFHGEIGRAPIVSPSGGSYAETNHPEPWRSGRFGAGFV